MIWKMSGRLPQNGKENKCSEIGGSDPFILPNSTASLFGHIK